MRTNAQGSENSRAKQGSNNIAGRSCGKWHVSERAGAVVLHITCTCLPSTKGFGKRIGADMQVVRHNLLGGLFLWYDGAHVNGVSHLEYASAMGLHEPYTQTRWYVTLAVDKMDEVLSTADNLPL